MPIFFFSSAILLLHNILFLSIELSEDKSLAIGQNADDGAAIAAEDDQTTFDVKYLGNTPVDSAAGAVAEAVKTILVMVSYMVFHHYYQWSKCIRKDIITFLFKIIHPSCIFKKIFIFIHDNF